MKLALHWKILIGLALGLVTGLLLNQLGPSLRTVAGEGLGSGIIDFLIGLNQVAGDIFKRSLQFIAAPIILFAMVLAISSLGDLRKLGRIGLRTTLIFMCTALTATATGLALVNIVKPGGDRFISKEAKESLLASMDNGSSAGILNSAKSTKPWDLVRDIMPTNPFESLAKGDMLQIVVLALMIGIALSMIPRAKAEPVFRVVEGLHDAFILIVRGIMRLAPIGVFCLITPIVANLGFAVLSSLAAYCITVIIGLCLLQFLVYPFVVKLFTPIPLREFFRGIAQVQMVGFSSSSSAATLPVTIENVRENLGVPGDIASFVCALGAKMNMDGTAMMQAIATVFLAQFYAMDLSIGAQASIVFIAVVSAIGSPGVPSGGMVMLVIVLKPAGVPAEGIAMILAVDRILDMCRTVVNVTGDASTAVAVASMEKSLVYPPPAKSS